MGQQFEQASPAISSNTNQTVAEQPRTQCSELRVTAIGRAQLEGLVLVSGYRPVARTLAPCARVRVMAIDVAGSICSGRVIEVLSKLVSATLPSLRQWSGVRVARYPEVGSG